MESVEGVPGLRVGSGYAHRTMTVITRLRLDGYERDARTYCRFGGNGSDPDTYGFPQPREGMARTTMHKIVSEVAVDAVCVVRMTRSVLTENAGRANCCHGHAQAEQSGDLAKPCEMLGAHSPSKILCIVQVSRQRRPVRRKD